ncbi:MAG: LacI family DNA-binding transcriptional regulator [Eubacteriales bacterium]|nr:LacI family DNA-binding transcriptional regulator [Eubacteriales bacterium]
MATIKEIAERAGVSRGTVDRVLNGRGSVNAATAALVRDIARQLDYRPNRAGMALAAQRRNLKLGVILFDQGNPFFEDVWKGVSEKETELAGYNCTLLKKSVAFSAQAQAQAMDELDSQGIDGLVISPFDDGRIADRINRLAQRNVPVITANTDIHNSRRLAFVGSDFYRCGQTAAGLLRLITHGPVQAGIVTGSSQVLCHTGRIQGFCDRIASCYPQIRVMETIENGDDDFESYDKTLALLARHPRLNALYFTAAGVYGGCRAIQASGRHDIRVIAYDKIPSTAQLMEQDIISAVICQQPKVQGSRPLQLLFDYLTAGEAPERECYYTAVDVRIRENIR